MNDVHFSGNIISISKHSNSFSPCLQFEVSKTHRRKNGDIKNERYTVNCWNSLALWADSNLQTGQSIVLRGYLTQQLRNGTLMTEITATKIVICTQINTKSERILNENTIPELACSEGDIDI